MIKKIDKTTALNKNREMGKGGESSNRFMKPTKKRYCN